MDGKLCSSGEGGTDGKDLPVCTCMCGSAHDCGRVIDGSNGAMVASWVLLLLLLLLSLTDVSMPSLYIETLPTL